jgi:hypothetical protein
MGHLSVWLWREETYAAGWAVGKKQIPRFARNDNVLVNGTMQIPHFLRDDNP